MQSHGLEQIQSLMQHPVLVGNKINVASERKQDNQKKWGDGRWVTEILLWLGDTLTGGVQMEDRVYGQSIKRIS